MKKTIVLFLLFLMGTVPSAQADPHVNVTWGVGGAVAGEDHLPVAFDLPSGMTLDPHQPALLRVHSSRDGLLASRLVLPQPGAASRVWLTVPRHADDTTISGSPAGQNEVLRLSLVSDGLVQWQKQLTGRDAASAKALDQVDGAKTLLLVAPPANRPAKALFLGLDDANNIEPSPLSQLQILTLSPEELPDLPELLQLFGAVAIAPVHRWLLTPAQGRALMVYAREGGTVMLLSGEDPAGFEGSVPVMLLGGEDTRPPLALQSVVRTPAMTRPEPVRGSADASLLTVTGGKLRPVLFWGEEGLLWHRRLGLGHVWLLSVDLRRESMVERPPRRALRLMAWSLPHREAGKGYLDNWLDHLRETSQEMLEQRHVPLWPFAAWLMAYGAAMGWAASSKRRMILRFLVVTGVGTTAMGGMIVWFLNTAQGAAAARWHLSFSPDGEVVSWEVQTRLLSGRGEHRFSAPPPTPTRLLMPGHGGSLRFTRQWSMDVQGRRSLTVRHQGGSVIHTVQTRREEAPALQLRGDPATGMIEVKAARSLHDVFLYTPSHGWWPLGHLEKGAWRSHPLEKKTTPYPHDHFHMGRLILCAARPVPGDVLATALGDREDLHVAVLRGGGPVPTALQEAYACSPTMTHWNRFPYSMPSGNQPDHARWYYPYGVFVSVTALWPSHERGQLLQETYTNPRVPPVPGWAYRWTDGRQLPLEPPAPGMPLPAFGSVVHPVFGDVLVTHDNGGNQHNSQWQALKVVVPK